MSTIPPKFPEVLKSLELRYGVLKPEQPTDPFGMILWEKIGYLCDDAKRMEAFRALKKFVGITPQEILKATLPMLEEICKIGGIQAELRAKRLQECSKLVKDDFGGDLRKVLKLPCKQAVKAFCKFPYIGEPSAERILLFSGTHPLLALESNALRVLLRLGFGKESKNYTAMYRSVREALAPQLPQDPKILTRATLVLRRHGQTLCKTTSPQCGDCPLVKSCAFAVQLAKLRPKPVRAR